MQLGDMKSFKFCTCSAVYRQTREECSVKCLFHYSCSMFNETIEHRAAMTVTVTVYGLRVRVPCFSPIRSRVSRALHCPAMTCKQLFYSIGKTKQHFELMHSQ